MAAGTFDKYRDNRILPANIAIAATITRLIGRYKKMPTTAITKEKNNRINKGGAIVTIPNSS
jgi:hypothetical protein